MLKYVFFFFFWTLTDPAEGITGSVLYALDKFGIEENKENLLKFIGPPLLDSFRDFYGFDEQKCWKAVEYYRERFGKIGLFENEVYCGIIDVLEALKKKGLRLLVATSKPTFYSKQILDKFGLSPYFEYVSGSDMNEKNSNKATIIKAALDYCKALPEEVLMVGDRFYDIVGAKENGIKSAGVLYGYGSYAELSEAGADYIFETVDDLMQIIGM